MRYVKSFIITTLCLLASKFTYTQNVFEFMYVHLDTLLNMYAKDTLYASLGPWGEETLILANKKDKSKLILSRWRNLSTPQKVSLVRVGKDLYKIDGKIIVKLEDYTLEKALQYNHCSHSSHYSHYSGK